MLEPTPLQIAMLAEKMSVHGLLRGSQEERQEFAAIVWRLVAHDVLAAVADRAASVIIANRLREMVDDPAAGTAEERYDDLEDSIRRLITELEGGGGGED